jgi:hypothetical protein
MVPELRRVRLRTTRQLRVVQRCRFHGDQLGGLRGSGCHRRYPKPGIPDQEEHDRLWLSTSTAWVPTGRALIAKPSLSTSSGMGTCSFDRPNQTAPTILPS